MKNLDTKDWTEQEYEELRALWEQKDPRLSAAVIGMRFKVSKNAIISRARAIGCSPRDNPIIRKDGSAPKRSFASRQIRKPPPEKTMAIQAEPEHPVFSRQTCQWPIGMPKQEGFHFCGDKALYGKPYCESHCKQAYRQKAEETEVDSG